MSSEVPGEPDEGDLFPDDYSIPDLGEKAAREKESFERLDYKEKRQTESLSESERIDLAKKKEDVRNKKQNRFERKKYANRIFKLIVWWLLFVGGVTVFQGIRPFGFELSTPVMLALIGGTTTNVLGIFYFVAKYLFDTDNSSQPS